MLMILAKQAVVFFPTHFRELVISLQAVAGVVK